MVWKLTNNSNNKEYIFKYVKLRINGYTNYTEFEIPGGDPADNQSLPLGGSGVLFEIDWSMKDDGEDISNGTNSSAIETPDEQETYWINSIAQVGILTSFTLTKGGTTYGVSINNWDINVDPTDPNKNDCSVSLKLSKNALS